MHGDLGFGIWDLGFGIWDLGLGGVPHRLCVPLAAGEAFGEALLEKPLRGVPILAGSLVKLTEDRDGAFSVGPLEVCAKFGVAPCLSLDGAFGTAEEVGNEIERGAVGEEVAGDGLGNFVHDAWTGHGGAFDLGFGIWGRQRKKPAAGIPGKRGSRRGLLLDAEFIGFRLCWMPQIEVVYISTVCGPGQGAGSAVVS